MIHSDYPSQEQYQHHSTEEKNEEGLIESEYEFTFSQVPSEPLSPRIEGEGEGEEVKRDGEMENRLVGFFRSSSLDLGGLEDDRELSSTTIPTEELREGERGDDIEPGWRRRRNGLSAQSTREEEEFLLLSEDLSIEEMEILHGNKAGEREQDE